MKIKRYLFCSFVLLATLQDGAWAADVQVSDKSAMLPEDVKSISGILPIFSERIVMGLPAGWKIAYEKPSSTHYIIEFIPKEQTLTAWQEMLTVQGHKGVAKMPGDHTRGILFFLSNQIETACGKGFIVRLLENTVVDGHAASQAVIGCANLPQDHPSGIRKGEGEVAYYLAIKGIEDVYVIHRSIRRPAFNPENSPLTETQIQVWQKEAGSIKFCGIKASVAECMGSSQ